MAIAHLFLHLQILLLMLSTGAVAYNATTDQDDIVCVYPLSGQYGVLPRFLYYAVLAFAVLGRKYAWLVAGALAYALTYSGTAAIHAFVIACISNNTTPWDLDGLGTWAVVSIGCLTIRPVLARSATIRDSQFQPLFGLWGTLVSVGAVCSVVAIIRGGPLEAACRSNTGVLLGSASGWNGAEFNCTYMCFQERQPLRSQTEIVVVSADMVFRGQSETMFIISICITTLFGILVGIFSFYSASRHRKKTEAELKAKVNSEESYRAALRAEVARRGLQMRARDRIAARRDVKQGRAYKELASGTYSVKFSCLGIFNPILTPVVIIFNEIYLLGDGGFPVNEQPFAIGQWAPIVGVGLALIAAAVIKYKEPKWLTRQAILESEKKAREERETEEIWQDLKTKNNATSDALAGEKDREDLRHLLHGNTF